MRLHVPQEISRQDHPVANFMLESEIHLDRARRNVVGSEKPQSDGNGRSALAAASACAGYTQLIANEGAVGLLKIKRVCRL